ncbi:thermostable hemolysin [Pollutimonas nitritireducens]|nr:thermostable hemolysin [Pollutimonas nitritireducens]
MLIAETHMARPERSSRMLHHTPEPRFQPQPLSLHIHQPGDPMRPLVESYIQQRYQQRFGAHLKEWLPTLVSMQANGEILAAAGYRVANDPLFLERYLAAPIEHYVHNQDAPVARNVIVEVGQFAAARPGAGRLLVPLLVRHLRQQGFNWAVSTLTSELHHLLARMGIVHQPLSEATAEYLSEQECKDWGSYYAHAPHVFAGRLDTILDHFPESAA